MKLRRIVTGHDTNGRAIVSYDGDMDNLKSRRPGITSSVVWMTDKVPANNIGDEDVAKLPVATNNEQGSVFRVVEYQPNVTPRRHRTSSVDYAIVLSGEIDMELDDGVEVHLEAGDVLVQRGTIHNWINRGKGPCRMAFVLIAADPVANAMG